MNGKVKSFEQMGFLSERCAVSKATTSVEVQCFNLNTGP